MKKRILSCLMALALCLTLLPTAALAEETEGTAQTPPAVEEPADPANGEAKQESQSAEQEEQQEDSASKQDGAVAAVQAMIDALPDASELDGMDGEARESACLAASEAYDAYDALTEKQQSALTGAEKMIAILKWATRQVELLAEDGDVSKHTDHTGWMAIGTAQELTSITSSGNYYLTDDVTLTENEAWKPADGVVLCLNGYSITGADGQDVITVNNGVTFTLCDCKGSGSTGKVTHSDGNGGGVYVNGGTFTMTGSTIEKNTATDPNTNYGKGGGVYINGGTFTMTGGSITNNTALDYGGVCVGENATAFTVGGNVTVTGNKSSGTANDCTRAQIAAFLWRLYAEK